jgi:hypothetical protein
MERPRFRQALASLSSIAVTSAVLFWPKDACAEMTLFKSEEEENGWEFYTNGRLNAFFSWNRGEGYPVAPLDASNAPLYQFKPGAGGTGAEVNVSATPIPLPGGGSYIPQGTIDSMRIRSGFIANVVGFGIRKNLNATTKVSGFVSIWSVVESEARRKYFPNLPDVREGYVKIEGPWGSFLAGKALTLFNRGATDADFRYLHGYALGYPGDIDIKGPAAGLIGFGILGSTFSGGLVYATPTVAGVQLSAGIYDPAALTGSGLSRTGAVRPEFELTVDEPLGTLGKVHVFLNGTTQKLYRNNEPDSISETAQGFGTGARVELGPVRLAAGLHRGKGLGLFFALQPSDSTFNDASQLRHSEGFFAIGQLVLGKFDINLGYGRTRITPLGDDMLPDPTKANGYPKFSLIRSQTGMAAAVVFHAADWLHFAADVMHADFRWTLNDRQQVNFFNAGTTFTW